MLNLATEVTWSRMPPWGSTMTSASLMRSHVTRSSPFEAVNIGDGRGVRCALRLYSDDVSRVPDQIACNLEFTFCVGEYSFDAPVVSRDSETNRARRKRATRHEYLDRRRRLTECDSSNGEDKKCNDRRLHDPQITQVFKKSLRNLWINKARWRCGRGGTPADQHSTNRQSLSRSRHASLARACQR